MSDLHTLDVADLAHRVQNREVSPVEVAEHTLSRLVEANDPINAVVWHDAERFVDQAQRLADRIAAGDDVGRLAGVPHVIKDMHAVAGAPRTMGSPLMAGIVDEEHTVSVQRLADAGALFLGKSNMPEFAWKGVTDCHQYGATGNPWDPTKTAGGSSGGTAAAVGAGIVPFGDGSDAGGSIRIPAALCGVVGFKPSHGRVPVDFLTYSETNVHLGPIARSVGDAALLFEVMAGGHSCDPASIPGPAPEVVAGLERPPERPRVAWSLDLGHFSVEENLATVFESCGSVFEADLGARVTDSAPPWRDPLEIMWRMYKQVHVGAADLLAARGSGLVDEELLDLVQAAVDTPAVEFAEGDKWRKAMWTQLGTWFEDYDYLVLPTTTCTAFDLDRQHPSSLDGAPFRERLASWIMAWPFSLMAPCPVISVPAGLADDGLPVGLQIVGRPWDDAGVLRMAAAFESARPMPTAR